MSFEPNLALSLQVIETAEKEWVVLFLNGWGKKQKEYVFLNMKILWISIWTSKNQDYWDLATPTGYVLPTAAFVV